MSKNPNADVKTLGLRFLASSDRLLQQAEEVRRDRDELIKAMESSDGRARAARPSSALAGTSAG